MVRWACRGGPGIPGLRETREQRDKRGLTELRAVREDLKAILETQGPLVSKDGLGLRVSKGRRGRLELPLKGIRD